MEKTNGKNRISRWFKLCPVRHILIAAFGLLIAVFLLLRGNSEIMNAVTFGAVRPYQRFMAGLCSHVPFSAAEMLIALAVLAVLVYIIYQTVTLIRRPEKLKRAYRALITLAAVGLGVYALLSWTLGVCYYADDFSDQSGLEARPVSSEQLAEVTRYFAEAANYYGEQVQRDENGVYVCDEEELLIKTEQLYDAIAAEFPCLDAVYIRPKIMLFSEVMSMINFTGVFFPLTGEANVNGNSPQCYRASTLAHEMAHQRGVASESEANFVAVAACMAYGDPDFCYSAALLAYVHLGNALHRADADAWREIYSDLSDNVLRDYAANRAYWDRYSSPVGDTATAAYDGFLKSNGIDGVRSYGACVDLLVAYFGS